jgi:hypothetical protein
MADARTRDQTATESYRAGNPGAAEPYPAAPESPSRPNSSRRGGLPAGKGEEALRFDLLCNPAR